MSEPKNEKPDRAYESSPLRTTIIVGVLVGIELVTLVHFFGCRHRKEGSRRVGHSVNLRLVGENVRLYAEEHGNVYPTAEKWCDLLVEWSSGYLRNALRYPAGEHNGCPYALNPHADPSSPPDVVLLFESKAGWNQFGGPELLTTENHQGKGCFVAFADGHVEFIAAAEIPRLKWTNEGSSLPDVQNVRRPRGSADTEYWLENMISYHSFTTDEVCAATGLTADEVVKAQKRSGIRPHGRPAEGEAAPLLILPYPGGRHPRIGFLEGAVDPQRETKFSVFTPWDSNSYIVVDVPEAIWSNLGLTYLAHKHIDTIWTKQGIDLPKLEWNRRADGSLDIRRTLPNGIAFGVKAVPTKEAVRMEVWLKNGSIQKLSDLRVQICVMTKMAAGFAGQTNANKVFTNPYVACRSEDGKRWIVTAWENCGRSWGNEQCPCFHSDPKFPDLEPGQEHRLHGWLSFYEGNDIQSEFARIEALHWRQN